MNTGPEKFLSPVVKELPPSGIRKFFDLVANTKGVVSLGVGEPDFVTPWHVREACVYSLEKGYTMYTSNFGMPELREEISKYLGRRYGVDYNPANEVLVTVGASEAVDLALRAVLTPGDEVLIPEPCYVSYKPCTVMAGGTPVVIKTVAENEFRLTAEQLRKCLTPRSKVLIMCYPNNPTGAIMTRWDLEAIAQVVREHDILVISDEIYSELTYDGSHTCFASLPGMWNRTILLNGFSKAFAMTGWRVGYAAAHHSLIGAMVKIHQYTMLCASVMGQIAAIEALRNGASEVERMVEQYNQRRRLIISRLRGMGLDCFEPKGAFYAFPSIKATGLSSEEFCEQLLKEEK
ncbi:MAG: aminotransferase class I/II-fold pyridoxal phosphate-dependent enzyme, partial [Bacillota bacterium]